MSINVNLLPWRKQQRRARIVLLGLIFFISAVFLLMLQLLFYSHMNREEKKLHTRLETETGTNHTLREALEKQELFSGEIQKLTLELSHWGKAERGRVFVTSVLTFLSEVTPDGVVLTDLRVEGNKVRITGISKKIPEITGLGERIRSNENTSEFKMESILSDEAQGAGHGFTLNFIYRLFQPVPVREEE